MITSVLMGGMGNQCFQYAFGLACAKRLNTELQLDVSLLGGKRKYVLDQWNITEKTVTGVEPTVYELGNMVYSQELVDSIKDGDCLQGYWQSEKYFESMSYILHNYLSPKQPINDVIKEQLLCSNTVAVHVRRDDYLVSPHKEFHGLLEMDYYNAAMNWIRERMNDVSFFIFSEDTRWANDNFQQPDTVVVKPGSETEDIYLMSLCNHAIIANSSFSWWGAWLGDVCWNMNRVVIAPKEWFKDPRTSYQDLVPERWIRL